jgi:CDP-glycerol glycerophosphotransferase
MSNNSSPQLWIFGSWLGTRYADNSKYLFEYVSKQPGHTAVWFTRSRRVYKQVNTLGYRCVYFYSLQSLLLCFRARYVVTCVAYNDIPLWVYLLSRSATYINLWHGTPLKRLVVNRHFLSRLLRRFIVTALGREVDMVISSSPEISEVFTDYFHIPLRSFAVTGYPRNDGMWRQETYSADKGDTKYILFIPTFRDYAENVNLFEQYGFNIENVEAFLREKNAVLYVRLHPKDIFRSAKVFESVRSSQYIRFLTDEYIKDDLYPFLGSVDVLITDYSSVYLDFLLLDRPIIFSAFDIETYVSHDRGFYFNYEEVTPGPKVRNWGDILYELEKLLSGDDDYKGERAAVNNRLNTFTDNNNSKRAFRAIVERNDEKASH